MTTEIRAPMQGKILELLLSPGDEVEEDEPVLMLEALKMKIAVAAPVDGVLRGYAVAAGDEVDADAALGYID